MDNAKQYPQCIPFKRPPRDYGLIADEADNTSFEILPLFEKTANDNMEMFLHSFTTNKLLSCRWQAYKDQYSTREYKPFQFPDLRDYHFFKYHTRLLPTESLKNRSDYRMKLQPGPGVDFRGQMPIPNELHMKRGTRVPKITKNVKVPKSQKT